MKTISILFLLVIGVAFGAVVVTPADVAGDGVAHAVASSGSAHWVLIKSADQNATTSCSTSVVTGCVRVGDSSISTSRGTSIMPGASVYLPNMATNPDQNYDLSTVFYLVQSGDKIQISYGK